MEEFTGLLGILNSLSPLAVIALLALVLLYQAKNNKATSSQMDTLNTIKGNDLHELPDIAENIRAIAVILQRIEVSQSENFSYIRARLNGSGGVKR